MTAVDPQEQRRIQQQRVIAVQAVFDTSYLPGAWTADPTVTNTVPNTRIQNTAAATITVNGTNFATDAKIEVDGVQQTTTRVSALICTMSYAPGPIGTGTRSIRVRNVAVNEVSNAVNLTVTAT
jgi:hypothetical protein